MSIASRGGSIVAAGSVGAAGLMVWEGAYNAATSYSIGDGCRSTEGRTFISRTNLNVGNAPPSYPDTTTAFWDLVAEMGPTGAATGDLVKSGTYAADSLLGCVGTGYTVKAMGAFATLQAAALTALAETTGAPAGTEAIPIYSGSAWKQISLNNLSQRCLPVRAGAGMFEIPDANGAEAITSLTLPTYLQKKRYGSFAKGVKNYYDISFALPENYNAGDLLIRFKWFTNTTSTGAVVLGAKASCSQIDGSLDVDFGAAAEVTDAASGTAYDHLETDSITVTPSNVHAGADLTIRIYRDGTSGSDTMQEIAYLLYVDIDVPVNAWSV
jgi:hypothetical protein